MTTRSHTGTIRTTSRLRTWYYVHLGGCQVRSVWREPNLMWWGQVHYKNRWVLTPKPQQAIYSLVN